MKTLKTLTAIALAGTLIAGASAGCTKKPYRAGNPNSVRLTPTSPIWSSPANRSSRNSGTEYSPMQDYNILDPDSYSDK